MKDPKKLVCNVELAKQLDELDIHNIEKPIELNIKNILEPEKEKIITIKFMKWFVFK